TPSLSAVLIPTVCGLLPPLKFSAPTRMPSEYSSIRPVPLGVWMMLIPGVLSRVTLSAVPSPLSSWGDWVVGAAGAGGAMVRVRELDNCDTPLPGSTCEAVMVWLPSVRVMPVKVAVPDDTVAVPSDVAPSQRVTVAPLTPVTVNVSEVFFVRLSLFDPEE